MVRHLHLLFFTSTSLLLLLFLILLVSISAASTPHGKLPDGSFSSHHGRHVVGHVDDFKALQQQILEGSTLLHKMEAALRSLIVSALQEFSLNQVSRPGSQRSAAGHVTL